MWMNFGGPQNLSSVYLVFHFWVFFRLLSFSHLYWSVMFQQMIPYQNLISVEEVNLYPYIRESFISVYGTTWASLVAQIVTNLPEIQETWVWSLVWEDPLEKGKVTHSCILAWRIPWTTVHGVTKSRTQLNDFCFHFHFFSFYYSKFCRLLSLLSILLFLEQLLK